MFILISEVLIVVIYILKKSSTLAYIVLAYIQSVTKSWGVLFDFNQSSSLKSECFKCSFLHIHA